MGAYTSVTSSEFNGFEPPEVIVDDSLPDVADFDSWPTNLKYVSHVKAPEY